jgi:hypothetical protein
MNSVGKILHTDLGNSFADVLTWVLVSKSSTGRGWEGKGVNNNKVKSRRRKAWYYCMVWGREGKGVNNNKVKSRRRKAWYYCMVWGAWGKSLRRARREGVDIGE